MADSPKLEIPFDQVAILFAISRLVFARMNEADPPFDERGHKAVPRDVMTCGQAAALIPLVVALLPKLYPDLLDDEIVDAAIRTAVLPSQTIQ